MSAIGILKHLKPYEMGLPTIYNCLTELAATLEKQGEEIEELRGRLDVITQPSKIDDDDMLIDEDEDDQPQPAEEESDFDTEEGWEKAIQPESATKKPEETFIGGVPIAKTTIYSAGIRIGRSELNMTHTKELAEWLNKYLAAYAAEGEGRDE